MKKVLFILSAILFLTSTSTSAQSSLNFDSLYKSENKPDSGAVKLPITLKAKQHFFLIDFLELGKEPSKLSYLNQVLSKMDTAFNPEKPITVNVDSKLVIDLYVMMGTRPERITTIVNADIKTALLPQVAGYSWIMRQLIDYSTGTQSIIDERTKRGFDFAKQAKLASGL